MKRPQSALFDRLAAVDRLYVYPPESLEKLNVLVPDKGRTLDVGCGDGAIPEAYDTPFVAGLDISFRCAALARHRGIRALVSDVVGGIPFANAAFDTVYCVDVLDHLEQQWEPVFTELDRVLRPGGTLAIIEPDARNPFVRWTQAPNSPIRLAPYGDEPAIDPSELLPHLERRSYVVSVRLIQIEGEQMNRSIFPLWQRLAKAPFTLTLAWWYRDLPNKFVIIAQKPRPVAFGG